MSLVLLIILCIVALVALVLLAGLAALLVAVTRHGRGLQEEHSTRITRGIEKIDALQASGRVTAAESAELRQALEEQTVDTEAPAAKKRLRKSSTEVLAGVCGGLAEWLNWDPTLVRVGYVLATLLIACFPGVIVYLILALVMPPPVNAPPARTDRGRLALLLILGPLLLAAAALGWVLLARLAHAV
jgi:phage shock protein C